MNEDPRLYDLAKRITLEAGYPWTDPRTRKTYKPEKKHDHKRRTKNPKKRKKAAM